MTTSRHGEVVYLAGRAAGMGARPLYLLVCNHFFGNAAAAIVASVLLIAMALSAVSGVDAHRIFYARRFGDAPGCEMRAYIRYVFCQFIVGIVGFALCAIYIVGVEGGLWLALAAGLYFASERLADEVLRYRLFERDRARWGKLMLIRTTVQMLAVGLIVLMRPAENVPAYFVAAMFAGNLVAFTRWAPWVLIRRCMARPPLILSFTRNALAQIGQSGLIWVLSVATMMSTYLDRLIVLASDKSDLAIFSLIVAAMSLIQNAVDYFYFSQRRREILEGKLEIVPSLLSWSFALTVSGSLICGLGLTVIITYLYHGAIRVPLTTVALVATIQITLGASQIAREIAYWNNQLHALLRVELVFLTLLGILAAALYPLHLAYVWLLVPALGALLTRFVLLVRLPKERIPIG